ncbi:MAG: NADH-quinone oxidoreductase subunit M [Thermodesulfobacteriota bacterium]
MEQSFPVLTFIIFFPMVGVLALLFTNKEQHFSMRCVALFVTVLEFLVSLILYRDFQLGTAAFQFVERQSWVESLGITYSLGIDGISLFLVLLTTLLTAISVLASWTDIKAKVKEFLICLLFLETGMVGVFCALDLFLFYVFWEVMLIPMYLLIGIWGTETMRRFFGREMPARVYSAIKFVLFTMVGSLMMLVAILVLYFHYHSVTGTYTFDLLKYYEMNIPVHIQAWLFLAFFLAFAIKVPMFPFHTWLPDAHTEAPTVGSVLLAAVLLKMGTYGFLRFSIPLFPNAALSAVGWISVLAIIGIIYGAWVAMVQKDAKRLVAFSSVSHLGFVMLGMFALTMQGVEGSILQMINHGLSTGALFLVVGMIYERRHTRLISEYGGVSRVMPIYAAFFMIFTLSSIGLPGLNGFVGEFLILLGTFLVNKTYAVIAATGVIFAAVYMLWMYQRVFFGALTNPKNYKLSDLNLREAVVLIPLVIAIAWIGVYPKPFLQRMEPSVAHLLHQVKAKSEMALRLDEGQGSSRVAWFLGGRRQPAHGEMRGD